MLTMDLWARHHSEYFQKALVLIPQKILREW